MDKKKIGVAVLASLAGIGVASAASAIVAYNKIFSRYERPDYSLTPGEYFYPRIQPRFMRTEFTFPSHGNKLQGYYYASSGSKGIIVICHGIHAGADDYLPLAESMVGYGYDVFAYDSTGTYSSEGSSTVGMCQQLIDLESAIRFIRSMDNLRSKPLFLIGHSWGAYAAATVLSLESEIAACACIAGMVSGPNMIVEKAKDYVGGLAHVPEPAFEIYQRLLFKDYVDLDAVKGINSVSAPVMIAHGVDDKVIRFDGQAIIAHKDKLTNPSLSYHIGKGLRGGHDSIWHSAEAIAYQMEIESELKLMKMKKGSSLDNSERSAFLEGIDHKLYSAPCKELTEKIASVFEKA